MGCGKPSKHEVKERADTLNQELLDTIQFLRSTPMFRNLPQHEHPMLAACCEVRVYKRNDVVVWEGEVGRELFVIKKGRANVYTQSAAAALRKSQSNALYASERSSRGSAQLGDHATSSCPVGELRPTQETSKQFCSEGAMTSSVPLAGASGLKEAANRLNGSKDSRVTPSVQFGTKVGTLQHRDYFGERALIWDELWDGTIVAASEELSCVVISQEKFVDLYARGKVHVPKRGAVVATALEDYDEEYESEMSSGVEQTESQSPGASHEKGGKHRDKTNVEMQLVMKALGNSAHLTATLDHLGPSRFEAFAKVAWKQEVPQGEFLQQPWSSPALHVVQEGMLEARGFNFAPSSRTLGYARMHGPCGQASVDMELFGAVRSAAAEEDTSKNDDVATPDLGDFVRMGTGSPDAEVEIGPGECVGEHSLIFEAQQPGSVQAKQRTVVWTVDRSDYDRALSQMSRHMLKERMIMLDQVDTFAPLLSHEKKAIAKAVGQQGFEKGQVICKEGDVEATFFLMYCGEVLVERNGEEVGRLVGTPDSVKYFGRGALFGTSSSSGNNPKMCKGTSSSSSADALPISLVTVTVLSTDGANCLTLARECMDAILGASQDLLLPETANAKFAKSQDFQETGTELSDTSTAKWSGTGGGSRRASMNSVISHRKSRNSRNSIAISIDEGQQITVIATPSDSNEPTSPGLMQHIASRNSRTSRTSSDINSGSPNHSPTHSPVATARPSKRKSSFASAFSSGLANLLGKEPANVQKVVKQGKPNINLKDLTQLLTIGKGAFGVVHLVVHKPTKKMYALKSVRKAKVIAKNMKGQLRNEKCILEILHSHFITRLICTFRTDQEILFLIEVALGGDLYSVYWKHRLFGENTHARYYAASVVCALEHMHERFVIYRDMKPENLLLDDKGRLKVTDFGLAKFVVGMTFTVCGTPVFFAPEIVQRAGYTHAVDWWALGILTWEFFVGHPPFHAQREGEVLLWLFNEKMLQGISKPKYPWPPAIPEEARCFFQALLNFKPSERLPMKAGGRQKFKELPWFQDFYWQDLISGSMAPPYLPQKLDLKNPGPLGYESGGMTLAEDEAIYEDDGTGWDLEFG